MEIEGFDGEMKNMNLGWSSEYIGTKWLKTKAIKT
jgi:hypothetical protein